MTRASSTARGLPSGVVVDASHIYWDARQRPSPTLSRHRPRQPRRHDGDPDFIAALAAEAGVAVDAGHIYWRDRAKGIARANLDGTNIDESFITDAADGRQGVAVDANHVFWAKESIARANLDGTGTNQKLHQRHRKLRTGHRHRG